MRQGSEYRITAPSAVVRNNPHSHYTSSVVIIRLSATL